MSLFVIVSIKNCVIACFASRIVEKADFSCRTISTRSTNEKNIPFACRNVSGIYFTHFSDVICQRTSTELFKDAMLIAGI